MVCCLDCYTLIGIAIILLMLFSHYRDRIFAVFMNSMAASFNPKSNEMKNDLFKSLHDIVSHDAELRKLNAIKVLEIGVGTGCNFKYYPDGTRLVVVDPNIHFASYYNKNRSEFANIQSEEIIITTGDKMEMIETGSIDAVVMTLVMCSIEDVTSTLNEIKRVLIPGGKFYFLEHGKEMNEDKYMVRMLQEILSVSKIWPFFFAGCTLNKDDGPCIEKAGFSSVEKKRVVLPFPMPILQPGIIGVAVK